MGLNLFANNTHNYRRKFYEISSRSFNTTKWKNTHHPRNAFQGRYNFEHLVYSYPALEQHVIVGPTGRETVDWANPDAVRALNTSLLVAHYRVNPKYSDILPTNALMAGVPGRADYVHHIADILSKDNEGIIPKGQHVIGMDIGTGASCIYPTIATSVYGWKMIATDINQPSLESAQAIVDSNNNQDIIDIRHQINNTSIFNGIIKKNIGSKKKKTNIEMIDFAMCNPPFYSSREDFMAESARKMEGLRKSKMTRLGRNYASREDTGNNATSAKSESVASSNNFGGTDNELWCKGGEVEFVKRIHTESTQYWNKCLWFSSLVSRKKNANKIVKRMRKVGGGGRKNQGVEMVHRIPIGRKEATILMWTFMDQDIRRDWAKNRWNT